MFTTKYQICIIWIVIMVLWTPEYVSAKKDSGNKSIASIGTAFIVEEDVGKAREDAVKDALSSAVEIAVSQLLTDDLIETHFQNISDQIYNSTQKFIKGYKVIVECQSGEFYRVMVRSTVAMDTLKVNVNSVGISLSPKKMPHILFFISEQSIENYPYLWWKYQPDVPQSVLSEKTFQKAMNQEHYQIVDRNKLTPQIWGDPAFQSGDLSDAAAIAIAKQNGAEIAIVGHTEAHLTPGIMGTNVSSVEAIIRVKAFHSETGKIIAETMQVSRAVSADKTVGAEEAIIQASQFAADDIIKQLSKQIDNVTAPSKIDMFVTGTSQLGNFVALRRILSNDVQGIVAIRLKEMKSNQARIEIDFPESAKVLAQRLMLIRFDSFGIQISDVTDSQLNLTILSKEDMSRMNQIQEQSIDSE